MFEGLVSRLERNQLLDELYGDLESLYPRSMATSWMVLRLTRVCHLRKATRHRLPIRKPKGCGVEEPLTALP
jgi:hypothetical protein